jgi:iron-sulfur cluster repair protein YtfE (RIC family)
MLIQIGPPKDPSDVVDLLLECHERIRHFIALAVRLANAENPSVDETREAAARVIRYFAEALPLHVADEEESILPRLSGREHDLDRALANVHHEHSEHELQLEQLLRTCRDLHDAPEKLAELRQILESTASTLQRDFLQHLDMEEKVVLPAIRQFLTLEEQAAILRELRARRSGLHVH